MFKHSRAAAAVLSLLLLSSAPSAAQSSTTDIVGTVTDGNGHPLAGATVTAEGSSAKELGTAVTDVRGGYRLASLPPGRYHVSVRLAGYRAAARDVVTLAGRATATVNITLDSPTTLGATFNREHLDAVPSAHDVWALLNQTPGIVMSDGVNVGGSGSGQQLSPAARGLGLSQVSWTIDGANVTDLVAVGSAPIYSDLSALDSVHVTTGGADASQQTAGIAIRLNTRSGSNTFRGSARGLFSDNRFESSNITPALLTQGTGAGVPLTGYDEYGAEAGGPITRDRIWWWAGSSVQDINGTVLNFYQLTSGCPPAPVTFDALTQAQSCLYPDRTQLINNSGSVKARLTSSQLLTVTGGFFDKTRNARQANSLTAIESTARQTGTTPRVVVRHSWAVNRGLVLESQASYMRDDFVLGFQTPDLANTQVFVDLATGATSRSLIDAETIKRPSAEAKTDGTWTLRRGLGSADTLKFGVAYRRSPTSTYSHTGGNVVARYNGSTPNSAVLYRDGLDAVRYDFASGYLQESHTSRRLTITGGLRWDLQKDRASAGSVPANPLAPDFLPAASFSGASPRVDFNDFAPRVSASYDLWGNGRTLVSGSYGFFYGQGIRLANALSLTGQVTEVVPWSDPNHDHIVEANEIPNGGVVSADFDAATGLTYPSGNTIDPNLKNSRTREATVSLDHEITRNLSVSASYVHRTYDRFIWTPGIDDTSANYIAKTWTDPVSGLTSTYYELKPGAGLSGFTETTNQPGRYLTYQGLDLMVRKRFGDRWMMNAALTLQSSIDHWPAGSYTDPTGIDKLNGQPGDPYLPRYLAKLNGRVLLPWGLGASATANIQDGFIRDIVFNGPPTRNGLPFTTLMAAPQGATRYPALTMVDVQVDKTVKLSARMRLTLNAVVFNAFNAGTVLSAVNNLSLTTYGNVLSLVGPRVARFGATITF